jgi:hypothetical protein
LVVLCLYHTSMIMVVAGRDSTHAIKSGRSSALHSEHDMIVQWMCIDSRVSTAYLFEPHSWCTAYLRPMTLNLRVSGERSMAECRWLVEQSAGTRAGSSASRRPLQSTRYTVGSERTPRCVCRSLRHCCSTLRYQTIRNATAQKQSVRFEAAAA